MPFVVWGATNLAASALFMLLVLASRGPVRRWIGPRLGYALWALPVVRMLLPPMAVAILPTLPLAGLATKMSILAIGTPDVAPHASDAGSAAVVDILLAAWAAGTVAVFATYAVRHLAFCRRLRAEGSAVTSRGSVRVVAADVEGPLAFGVLRRFVAVPRDFNRNYSAPERDLALAHEYAHHVRGDLAANWGALAVLAFHWWNPVAWISMRAFREDQEFAADAHVLVSAGPTALPLYASLLARTAGIGAPPACNLNARPTLKGRLIMLRQKPHSMRRAVSGGIALFFAGGFALAATAVKPTPSSALSSRQAVTIGVKPDGAGGYTLILGGTAVSPGSALPNGMTLPASFTGAGGCDLKPTAMPFAMAIKGAGGTRTYTILCASAAPAPIRATLIEGLDSLNVMRTSVVHQHTPNFPEAERTHALGAIDRSIREVRTILLSIS